MDNIIIIIIAEWSGEKLEKGDNGGEHVDWNGICIDDGLDFFLFFFMLSMLGFHYSSFCLFLISFHFDYYYYYYYYY